MVSGSPEMHVNDRRRRGEVEGVVELSICGMDLADDHEVALHH